MAPTFPGAICRTAPQFVNHPTVIRADRHTAIPNAFRPIAIHPAKNRAVPSHRPAGHPIVQVPALHPCVFPETWAGWQAACLPTVHRP